MQCANTENRSMHHFHLCSLFTETLLNVTVGMLLKGRFHLAGSQGMKYATLRCENLFSYLSQLSAPPFSVSISLSLPLSHTHTHTEKNLDQSVFDFYLKFAESYVYQAS